MTSAQIQPVPPARTESVKARGIIRRHAITTRGSDLKRAILAFAALMPVAASPLLAESAPPGEFTVAVSGLRSARGQLLVCLWRDKAGFPDCAKSTSAQRMAIPVTATSVRFAMPLGAAGTRAITLFHDEDANGRMRQNFLGMPLEGVGISNNPGGLPGYSKSLVQIAPGSTISIRMRYLFR